MPGVAITVAGVDELLLKMEGSLGKVAAAQGSIVKLPKAELDILKHYEAARDLMQEAVKSPDRTLLIAIFGGDCSRIARVRAVLEACEFSEKMATDQRIQHTKDACETIEKVLADAGLGSQLKQALEDQAKLLQHKVESGEAGVAEEVPEPLVVEEAVIEEPVVMEEPVVEEAAVVEPEPPKPAPEKEEPADPPAGDHQLDETLIEKILACTLETLDELMSLEPNKSETLWIWMIWMVHRAYLNDPTLIKFDFTNLKMPKGKEEKRISPKLSKCIATNTTIEQFLMANSHYLGRQAQDLADSIKVNNSIKICNLDSNGFSPADLVVLATALGENRCIEEFKINNQHSGQPGREVLETFANAITANTFVQKLGMSLEDAHWRGVIDKQLMKNNDGARKRRKEAREAANAAKLPQ